MSQSKLRQPEREPRRRSAPEQARRLTPSGPGNRDLLSALKPANAPPRPAGPEPAPEAGGRVFDPVSGGELAPLTERPAPALTAPVQAKIKKPGRSARAPALTPDQQADRYMQDQRAQSQANLRPRMSFMSQESEALYDEVMAASPEQLRSDPELRARVLADYKTSMSQRLKQYDFDSYDTMFSAVFRGNTTGELATYNALMRANLPQGLVDDMLATARDPNGGSEEAMSHATDVLESDPNMQEILEAGMSGFGTSIHFSQPHVDPRTGRVVVGPDPERRSGMLMNNLMLRSIAPEITDRVARQRAVYAASRGGNYAGDQAAKNHFADLTSEAQSNGVGRDELNASIAFQKAVKEGAGQTQQGGRFRGLMARIFRRRRGY